MSKLHRSLLTGLVMFTFQITYCTCDASEIVGPAAPSTRIVPADGTTPLDDKWLVTHTFDGRAFFESPKYDQLGSPRGIQVDATILEGMTVSVSPDGKSYQIKYLVETRQVDTVLRLRIRSTPMQCNITLPPVRLKPENGSATGYSRLHLVTQVGSLPQPLTCDQINTIIADSPMSAEIGFSRTGSAIVGSAPAP